MLTFETHDQHAVCVVTLRGEAGVIEAGELAGCMIKLAAARPRALVFDVAGLTFISSLAMGEFVSLAAALRRFGSRLAIAAAPPLVRDALVRVRLDQAYAMFDTLDAAIAELRAEEPR